METIQLLGVANFPKSSETDLWKGINNWMDFNKGLKASAISNPSLKKGEGNAAILILD